MLRLIQIIAAGAFVLGGCKPGADASRQSGTETLQKAQQQIAEEHTKREAAEVRSREQESRASWWQGAAFIGFGLALASLFTGAILGSRARHDAKP